MREHKAEFEKKLAAEKADMNRKGPPSVYDETMHTFHVEGFTSTSFDRNIAEKFAIEGVWGGRTPVVIEMDIELNPENGRYSGF